MAGCDHFIPFERPWGAIRPETRELIIVFGQHDDDDCDGLVGATSMDEVFELTAHCDDCGAHFQMDSEGLHDRADFTSWAASFFAHDHSGGA